MMDIGITGLGRMGVGMAERWLRDGHRVVAHNRSRGPIDELAAKGVESAYTVEELVGKLSAPRAIWIMLPAGDVTEQMIQTLIPLLEPGDTIIDGGNTNFHDDRRRFIGRLTVLGGCRGDRSAGLRVRRVSDPISRDCLRFRQISVGRLDVAIGMVGRPFEFETPRVVGVELRNRLAP